VGKNLRPVHIRFFQERMAEHNRVQAAFPIPSDDEFLFVVRRIGDLSDVTVHLTDAYAYSELEYLARPNQLGRNSFVVLGLPHGTYADDVVEMARADGIGVGHIAKFMGALGRRNVWEYESPQEREARQRRERGEC
jgi:hypothetical protein